MIFWAVLLLAGLAAFPFLRERARKPMDEQARQDAPGRFVRLSQGITHFHWIGPASGPVAVCIHGLTTPSFVWQSIAAGLARMGFRVLVFDLYGRGYSDRPKGAQDKAFFLRQVDELLHSQEVRDDVTVIGFSMGGVIATAFAASQPARIRQLVLIAPAGMQPVGDRLNHFILSIPFVGRWIMLLRYPGMLRRGLREEDDLPKSVEGIYDLQTAELDWRGFLPAVHASLRDLLSESAECWHRSLKRAGVPVLAIWGSDDAVIPLDSSDHLSQWNSGARNRIIEGAGHGLPYTHASDVLALIEDFAHQNGTPPHHGQRPEQPKA